MKITDGTLEKLVRTFLKEGCPTTNDQAPPEEICMGLVLRGFKFALLHAEIVALSLIPAVPLGQNEWQTPEGRLVLKFLDLLEQKEV